MKKLLLLLLISFTALTAEIYANIENIKGQDYLWVTNYTGYGAYCYVSSLAGHFEFYVEPQNNSRYYPVTGEYSWGCE